MTATRCGAQINDSTGRVKWCSSGYRESDPLTHEEWHVVNPGGSGAELPVSAVGPQVRFVLPAGTTHVVVPVDLFADLVAEAEVGYHGFIEASDLASRVQFLP